MTQETYRTYHRGHRIALTEECDGTWSYLIEGFLIRCERGHRTGMESWDQDWEAYRAACDAIDRAIADQKAAAAVGAHQER